ncbi:MAG: formate dehydrogenase subunit alpha [Thermodesulfovibrionales bacterium]
MYYKVPTLCPYCGCGCGIYLHVVDGMITGVSPQRNHPVNKGSLCVKGWNCHEFIQHPERLRRPLVRTGPKGNYNFREVSWDAALGIVAERLNAIKRSSGPDSIGFFASAKCTNEENYLLMKFARAVIGTNNIDHCARLCHASTVSGLKDAFGSGAMTNSINEIKDARLIFIIGSNTTEQHPMIGMHILEAARHGATLIAADPRKNMIARLAHLYLQHKPGTDVMLINSMINVIINEGLIDIDFVKVRTENFENFEKAIREYTPERAEAITGVPQEDIRKAARLYASENRAMLFYGMGITQHVTGVQNVHSLANLVMLTAHIGHPATGLNPLRGQNNVQGACDMGALPDYFTGYQPVDDEASRNKFEKAWGVRLNPVPGLTLTEMISASLNKKIKALYIMGENPVISDPDINHTVEALKALEFLVVQDIFMSETALFADVVLPGVSFAEKDGTFTNTERRVQKIKKAIDPVGDSMPDWKIITELSNKMGYKMHYNGTYEIMEEIAFLTPIYKGILHHRLEDNFGIQWPCPDINHPGTPYLHGKRFSKGMGTFIVTHYIPPAELPDKEFPFILTTGRNYFQYHTGTMTRKTITLEREEPECTVEINPADASFLGIRKGEKIRISTRRGSIEAIASITNKIISGTIYIPFHFNEAPANKLTNPAIDPQAKIPEFKVCAARIEKIS